MALLRRTRKDAVHVIGVVHAQELLARRAWRLDPLGAGETRILQCLQHRAQPRARFGMAEAGVVLEAGGVAVEAHGFRYPHRRSTPIRYAQDERLLERRRAPPRRFCGAAADGVRPTMQASFVSRAATGLRRARWHAPARARIRTAGRTGGSGNARLRDARSPGAPASPRAARRADRRCARHGTARPSARRPAG